MCECLHVSRTLRGLVSKVVLAFCNTCTVTRTHVHPETCVSARASAQLPSQRIVSAFTRWRRRGPAVAAADARTERGHSRARASSPAGHRREEHGGRDFKVGVGVGGSGSAGRRREGSAAGNRWATRSRFLKVRSSKVSKWPVHLVRLAVCEGRKPPPLLPCSSRAHVAVPRSSRSCSVDMGGFRGAHRGKLICEVKTTRRGWSKARREGEGEGEASW